LNAVTDSMPANGATSLERKAFLSFFLCIFSLFAIWSLSNPMFAAPDEGQHMLRGEAVVRGQFGTLFEVPNLPVNAISCFAFQAEVSADCVKFDWSAEVQTLQTPTENYPPLFHGIVGLPSLFSSGHLMTVLMRLLIALICSGLWSFGFVFMRRSLHGYNFAISALLSLTPMALFLGGTVNPSGLATACGFCFLCSMIFSHEGEGPGRFATHLAGVTMGVFLFLRRDSVAWAAFLIVVVVFANLGGVPRWFKYWRVRIWAAVLFLAALASYNFFGGKTSSSFVQSPGSSANGDLGRLEGIRWAVEYLNQFVGKFGWLDTELPTPTYLLAFILLGGFIFAGIAFGRRLNAAVVGFTLLACLAVPVVIGYFEFPYFQARYMMPVSIGLVGLSGKALDGQLRLVSSTKRVFALFLTLFLSIQFVALGQNLRRYSVGRSGTWLSLFEDSFGIFGVKNYVFLVAYLIAWLCLVIQLLRVRRRW
jgi:hypothetical protein